MQSVAVQLTFVAGEGPKLTVPPARLLPVIVTKVPPVEGPEAGLIAVTVGEESGPPAGGRTGPSGEA